MKRSLPAVAAALALAGSLLTGCESRVDPLEPPTSLSPETVFVGSQRCADCHGGIAGRHANHGHAHILQRVTGSAPEYPFRGEVASPLPGPPPDLGWDGLSYVVGGFAWRAQFLDRNGYLVTGREAEYHLMTGEWVPYEPDGAEYDCGRCHTTGYTSDGHQGGLPGIVGTWTEPSVGCEACHGPGGAHVQEPSEHNIRSGSETTPCGSCHARNVGGPIMAWPPDAEGDLFIRNYSQFDELQGLNAAGRPTGPHRGLDCTTCHSPHVSTVFQADAGGVELRCTVCHDIEVVLPGGGQHTCVNCHMPEASLSAVKQTPYRADLRTHVFRIATDPPDSAMFYQDGDEWFARPFLNLEFACLQCHPGRDLDWVAEWAQIVHPDPAPRTAGR
ncbi:MAG: multiheme c-type cytochrome [Candidatus Krumholzibacteriia bacterium]